MRRLVPPGTPVLAIAWWSLLEGTLPLVSGLVIARATAAFLAGRIAPGAAWLLALPAAGLVGVVATRRLYPHLADLVEPLRNRLLSGAVAGTLDRAVAECVRPSGAPGSGAAVAQVIGQVDAVRNLLAALVRGVRQLVIPVGATLIGLALLAPRLALVTAPFVVAGVLGRGFLLRRDVRLHTEQLLAEERFADVAVEILSGLPDVSANGAETWAVAELTAASARAAKARLRVAVLDTARGAMVSVAAGLPVLAVLVGAAIWVPHGAVTVPELTGAVAYTSTTLANAVNSALQTGAGWLVSLRALLGRLLESAHPVLAEPLPDQLPAHPPANPVVVAAGARSPIPASAGIAVRMRGLTFRYGPAAEPVIDALDLDIAPGEHLAVIGPSGSGKSTLAFLLAGVLKPESGRVDLDGLDVHAWPREQARQAVVVIPQEAYVFAGSLRENLRYLNPQATDDDIFRAVTQLGLSPLIDRFGGLDAGLRAGAAALSAGEAQLLALGRAWLSPGRLIILDEAGSHLDPATELQAERALRQRGGTIVTIAHRLDTARRADRILLLDTTPVIGDDAELRSDSELYRRMLGQRADLRPARMGTT
jgi:ABC-type multidrug transport system fused ATPase/permease subunit